MPDPGVSDATPLVCLVVALPPEARPLVEAMDLEPLERVTPYRVFLGERVALTVSGIGKLSSASAVGYLAGLLGVPRSTAWLNFGIAGHHDLEIGTLLLAHRVVDQTSSRCSYPAVISALAEAMSKGMPGGRASGTAEIRTVDDAEREYQTDALYEMEAAGFMAATSRLSSAELVHVAKVVSDNTESPPERLDKHRIESIVSEVADRIAALTTTLADRAAELRALELPPASIDVYTSRLRFTLSQRRQLEQQLRRWRAFDPDSTLVLEDLDSMTGCRQVLSELDRRIDELETSGF